MDTPLAMDEMTAWDGMIRIALMAMMISSSFLFSFTVKTDFQASRIGRFGKVYILHKGVGN